jgi:hypothetical protein
MDLQQEIDYINGLDLPDTGKAAAIASVRRRVQREQQTANMAALRSTGGAASYVPGAAGVGAAQTAAAQASAEAYVPTQPSGEDLFNPVKWAYGQFKAAGYAVPEQPNGPLDRWGAKVAMGGMSWVEALEFVIRDYPAGTANITGVHWPNDPPPTAVPPPADARTVPLAAAAALRERQLAAAAAGTKGGGNPPPILPPYAFNPVLSMAGIPQIWFYDEPAGGWRPASAVQSAGDGREYVSTNPTGGGYWADKLEVALPHDNPAKFSAAQKMAMQYATSGGGNTQRAYEWLGGQLSPMDVAELGQMFGSSGSALLYNPLAGAAMSQLAAGDTQEAILARLNAEAARVNTDGYRESLAQLDDAWFAQAQATIAQFA